MRGAVLALDTPVSCPLSGEMGCSPQPSRAEFLDLKNICSFNKYLLSAYHVPDAMEKNQ